MVLVPMTLAGRLMSTRLRRAAVALKGGNGVGEAVRAQFRGIVDQDGHAGFDAGFNEERIDVEAGFADLAQRGFDGRHDRGDDDVRDLAGLDAIHLEKVDEEHAVLVGGLLVMGGDTPVGDEGGLFGGFRRLRCGRDARVVLVEAVEAELGVGVAYIESQQHGVLSLYPLRRLRRRADRRFAR